MVKIFLRLPRTWVLSVLLVQLDLLRHWNESTDGKDSKELDENFERWRDGLRGVSPVRCSPRTKIRAEFSSNLYSRELRTAGLTPHFHAEPL